MKRLTVDSIRTGLGGALLLLLLITVSALVFLARTRRANVDVIRSHDALLSLRSVLSTLQDAETGQRGFLLTGMRAYLAPYETARAQLPNRLDALSSQMSGDRVEQARVREIRGLSRDKLKELRQTIALRESAGPSAALTVVRTNRGKAVMDRIRDLVNDMESTEAALLADRIDRSNATAREAALTVVGGAALLFVWVALLTSAILRDVTRRDRAERAEREHRERLQVTLHSIGDAVIVTDRHGVVTTLNPVAEKLTGWDLRAAVGTTLDDVFRIANEETRRPVESPAAKALRGGVIVGLANHTMLLSRDGREIPIDDSAAPIRDGAGAMDGVILVFRDITERRRAESRLQESEERLRMALDAGRFGVWDWEVPNDRVTASERLFEVFGVAPGVAVGSMHDLLNQVHPDDLARVAEDFRSVVDRAEPLSTECRVAQPAGEVRWISIQGRVIEGAAGARRVLGVAIDITEPKRAEEALKAADRQKNHFLAVLAHELRNPLSAISNSVSLLKLVGPSEARLEKARTVIERQVQQQIRLLDDLLNVTRIAHGKIDLRDEPVDLARLVSRTAEDHRSAFSAAGLTLTVGEPDHPVWVRGDSARLVQILGNLLQNAQKYTDAGGEVTVTVRADRERACAEFLVEDTGIGIDPDLIPRLFEPFTQADRTLERSQGGLGLGLSMVKGLAALHGGGVAAESEGPGRGARFIVRLPLIEPPARPDAARGGPAARGRSQRILVIEDNEDGADSLRDLLEIGGHTVEVAYTGPAGVEAAKRFHPDLVLCDLGLPGMNGYSVARALRADPETSGARLVVITGYGQEEDRRRSAEAGFEAHLVKPIDFDELERILAELR